MIHTTLSITQVYKSPIRANKTPYCQNTTQPIGVTSHTTMELYVIITMTHHFSNIFLVELYGRSLLCPICQILPAWFHYTMFQRLCCFRLTTVLENCHTDTLHNIPRHKLATVFQNGMCHYDDVIMTMLASQITSLTVVYSILYSGVNQRKHQSSASLAFVREIHRGPVNFPHKWSVTRKMFPFDDVIMWNQFFWPALISNVVGVSLTGGNLGNWTACNNVKRYCTLPYCGFSNKHPL